MMKENVCIHKNVVSLKKVRLHYKPNKFEDIKGCFSLKKQNQARLYNNPNKDEDTKDF